MAAAIYDPVTTTDELIPSGETSSYRSNPVRLSEFTLSRKDPQYVPRAKAVKELELARRRGEHSEALDVYKRQKCRCAPVANPVLPTSAIFSPFFTTAPPLAVILLQCP